MDDDDRAAFDARFIQRHGMSQSQFMVRHSQDAVRNSNERIQSSLSRITRSQDRAEQMLAKPPVTEE